MVITEVRIKIINEISQDGKLRLRAFASIILDNAFLVDNIKVVDKGNELLVAMPSRELTDRCRCGVRNTLRSRYCIYCGQRLNENRASRDANGRTKLYADIAHPINSKCREMIKIAVLQEYFAELELSKQPGYVSHYDEQDTIPSSNH